MTITAYGRHRGISREAVQRACDQGRIEDCRKNDKGHWEIHVERTDRKWRPARKRSIHEESIGREAQERARKLHYEAEIQKLNLLQRRGELVERAAVEKQAFSTARTVREELLGVGPRIASELASMRDPLECERLVTEEIRAALEALADGRLDQQRQRPDPVSDDA